MSRRNLQPATRAAVRAAIERNSDDLLAYFERRVEIKADAADLLSETMLQAWRRADALPAEDHVEQRMWLYAVARNVLSNHRRTSSRRAALVDRLHQRLGTASFRDSATSDPADAVAVRDAINRLPPQQRELILLVHWDGFTIAHAARLTDVNASTARGRYAAARAALKLLLDDGADDPLQIARRLTPS